MVKVIAIVRDEVKLALEQTEIPAVNVAELIVSDEKQYTDKSLKTIFEESIQ